MALHETLISEFIKFEGVTAKYANAAFQVYLELCEVRKYWDVEYEYNDELKLLYFTAKKSKSENPSVFLPRCANEGISFNEMKSYFKLCEDPDVKSVFLALVSADSTCVYYEISDGLCKPMDTSAKHLRINKQEKLDAAIKKHRHLIEEAALCGTSVTIRNSNNE